MIVIGNTLVSEDLFDQEFICNLQACKGACCVEGDSGAPVTAEERQHILAEMDQIKPFLSTASMDDMNQRGAFEIDEEEEWVTTCLKTGECNFSVRDELGILGCGIEKSFLAGKSNFRKPSSCYLYPIRVVKVGDYLALNYHRWDICKAACALGKQEQVKVYQFLKQPLVERFGASWYAELCEIAEAFLKEYRS